MKSVKSTEFQNKMGLYQDMAQKEPIAVTRHNRVSFVLLSFEQYQKLTQESKRAIHPSQLSSEDLETIRNAKVPPEYAEIDE